ncbi:MAG: hypothetical protein V1745_01420 [Patescibacteria group bacterium]
MAFDHKSRGWGASPEGPEATEFDPHHLASLLTALRRYEGSGNVPRMAQERQAKKVAPQAKELMELGKQRATKAAMTVLNGMLLRLPTFAMPNEEQGRAWEVNYLEARQEGSDRNGHI